MVCAVIILIESARRVYKVLVKGIYTVHGREIRKTDPGFKAPDFGEA